MGGGRGDGDGAELRFEDAVHVDGEAGEQVTMGGRPGWRPSRQGAVAGLLLAVVATAVVLSGRGAGAPGPPPTSMFVPTTTVPERSAERGGVDRGDADAPLSVPGRLAVLLGDKLLLGQVEDPSRGSVLLGLIHTEDDDPRLWAVGRHVLAVGSGPDGVHGVWSFDATGLEVPAYLGAADAVVPASDRAGLWLTEQGTVRRVSLGGQVLAGPFPVDGQVVAASRGGLVLQRQDQVLWWVPGGGAPPRQLGVGRALDGGPGTVVWRSADGGLTLTDPRSGENTRLDDDTGGGSGARPEEAGEGSASLSPDTVHVVSTDGRGALTFHDRDGAGTVTVVEPEGASATWLTGSVALLAEPDGDLSLLDAVSGARRELPALPVAARAAAFVAEAEWRTPVVAERAEPFWEVRARADVVDGAAEKELDVIYFAASGPFYGLVARPDQVVAAQRLQDGTVVGVVSDPAVTTVRVEQPTGATVVPVTLWGGLLGQRIFAVPPVTVPGAVRIVALGDGGVDGPAFGLSADHRRTPPPA